MFINMNPETATGFGFFWLNSNAMGKCHLVFFNQNVNNTNFSIFQRSSSNPLPQSLWDLLEAFSTSSSLPDLTQGKLSVNTTKSLESHSCLHTGVWDITNANSGTILSIVLRKFYVKLKMLESLLMCNGTTLITWTTTKTLHTTRKNSKAFLNLLMNFTNKVFITFQSLILEFQARKKMPTLHMTLESRWTSLSRMLVENLLTEEFGLTEKLFGPTFLIRWHPNIGMTCSSRTMTKLLSTELGLTWTNLRTFMMVKKMAVKIPLWIIHLTCQDQLMVGKCFTRYAKKILNANYYLTI